MAAEEQPKLILFGARRSVESRYAFITSEGSGEIHSDGGL